MGITCEAALWSRLPHMLLQLHIHMPRTLKGFLNSNIITILSLDINLASH